MVVAYNDEINQLNVSSTFIEDVENALLKYLPIKDDGVNLTYHSWWIITGWDLTTSSGWNDVLDDLESMKDDYPNGDNYTWIGIVPDDPSDIYYLGGRAREDSRVVAAQQVDDIIAHEYVHTLGIDHSPCKEPGGWDPCDWHHGGCDDYLKQVLPWGRTENIGINVYSTHPNPIPAGRGDLMSYCDPCWTSIALWNYVRTKIGG